MSRVLVLTIAIALIAAPSAFGKALRPPLPPDARSAPAAQSGADSDESPVLVVAGVVLVLLIGAALTPRGRRRPVPTPG
jgi:hypothetical protein